MSGWRRRRRRRKSSPDRRKNLEKSEKTSSMRERSSSIPCFGLNVFYVNYPSKSEIEKKSPCARSVEPGSRSSIVHQVSKKFLAMARYVFRQHCIKLWVRDVPEKIRILSVIGFTFRNFRDVKIGCKRLPSDAPMRMAQKIILDILLRFPINRDEFAHRRWGQCPQYFGRRVGNPTNLKLARIDGEEYPGIVQFQQPRFIPVKS